MLPLCTADEVAEVLQRDLTAEESAAVNGSIDHASAIIRGYVRQSLTTVTGEVALLAGCWGPRLELPERPVTAVTGVEVNGGTLAATEWWWPGKGYLLRGQAPTAGNLTAPTVCADWGGPDAVIEVTYSHGYSPIPDDVRAVCVAVATRAAENPTGARSETIGQRSIAWGGESGSVLELTTAERHILNRYRVRSGVS